MDNSNSLVAFSSIRLIHCKKASRLPAARIRIDRSDAVVPKSLLPEGFYLPLDLILNDTVMTPDHLLYRFRVSGPQNLHDL